MLNLGRWAGGIEMDGAGEKIRVTRNVELPVHEWARFDAAVDRLGMLQKEVVARMLKWFLDLPAPEQNAIMHPESAESPVRAPELKRGPHRSRRLAD